MLISDTGRTRQIELTSLRVRAITLILAAAVAGIALLFFALGASMTGDSSLKAEKASLIEKVASLEEQLGEKQLALAVKKSEPKLAEAVTDDSPPLETPAAEKPEPAAPSESVAAVDNESPLTSLPGGDGAESEVASLSEPTNQERPLLEQPVESQVSAVVESPADEKLADIGQPFPGAGTPAEAGGAEDTSGVINFDATEVTASSDSANRGKLSFRLVKDHPDYPFSGYLFVFVEMVDERGENKIYAYPQRTRLGEGDLPMDYRTGESLTFKYNSRVELPYRDIRLKASLRRVSILLYNEDGSIVFQRGFARGELKLVGGKATRVDGVSAKPKKRRTAL